MSRSIPASGLTRRGFGGLSLAALAAGLVGCSSYDENTNSTSNSSGSGPFKPVTIDHKFGSTTVKKRPQRVVAAGYTEQDFLLALGVIPVAITDWYGDHPYGTWPWAQDELGDAKPTLLNLNDGPQYQRMKATSPDLILALNAGIDQKTFDKLEQVGPTIAQPKGASEYFPSWKQMLPMIGDAVGESEKAARIQRDLEKRFSDAKQTHPEWAGKKAIFLQNAVYDGSFIAYQDGLSTDFLTDLGFEIPSELDEFIGDGQAYIPVERIDVLDSADVLIWGTEADADKAALEKVAGFNRIKAVAANRSIYTGGELAGAIYFTSTLSLDYVLDQLVPMLEGVKLKA